MYSCWESRSPKHNFVKKRICIKDSLSPTLYDPLTRNEPPKCEVHAPGDHIVTRIARRRRILDQVMRFCEEHRDVAVVIDFLGPRPPVCQFVSLRACMSKILGPYLPGYLIINVRRR